MTVRALRWGQHVITAVLVVVCTVRAVSAGVPLWAQLVTTGLFVGWYFGGPAMVRRLPRRSGVGSGWLLVLAAFWLLMCAVSAENVWLAFPLWLLAGHLFGLRTALLFSVAVFAVVILRPWWEHGQPNYAGMIGPLIGGAFAVGLSRGQIQLVRDGQERQRLVESLLAAQDEMEQLSGELARSQRTAGVMAERTRLSRDIHDTIAQGLSSILLLARAGTRQHDEGSRHLFGQIETTAAENLTEVRRIVGALTPTALEEDGLSAAIDRLLTTLSEETGIRTELKAEPDLPAVSTTTEVALLRATQSALANVRQHARAGTVVISLSAADSSLRLDIIDDGTGFDPQQVPVTGPGLGGGYGLRAMRARLRELGGGLEVESGVGHGSAIAVHVPLGRTEAENRAQEAHQPEVQPEVRGGAGGGEG